MPETESEESNTSQTVESTESQPDPSQSPSKSDESEVKGEADKAKAADVPAGVIPEQERPIDSQTEVADTDNTSDSTDWDDDSASARRSRNSRAYYLRRLPARTQEQEAWLDEHEKRKGKPGRQRREPEAKPNESPPETDKPAPRQRQVRRPGPPPIIHEGGNWREKYNGGIDNGRELLCRTIGGQWHKWLVAMEADLKEAGITPITVVSDEATLNMFVCAVDDILPDRAKASPSIIAAIKTTALVTQRVHKRKAIADAAERKKRPLQAGPRLVSNQEVTTHVKPAAPTPEPEVRINHEGRFLAKRDDDEPAGFDPINSIR